MIPLPVFMNLLKRPQYHSSSIKRRNNTSDDQKQEKEPQKACSNCKYLSDCASPFYGTCREYEEDKD